MSVNLFHFLWLPFPVLFDERCEAHTKRCEANIKRCEGSFKEKNNIGKGYIYTGCTRRKEDVDSCLESAGSRVHTDSGGGGGVRKDSPGWDGVRKDSPGWNGIRKDGADRRGNDDPECACRQVRGDTVRKGNNPAKNGGVRADIYNLGSCAHKIRMASDSRGRVHRGHACRD